MADTGRPLGADERIRRRYSATWNGAVLAESEATVVVEGNQYFPLVDVRMEHLTESSFQTICGWKGVASYYDVVVDGNVNADAAWYYPDPSPAAAQIKGRVAFWHGVKVERAGPSPARNLPATQGARS